jgi:hypothetical protein
MTPTYTTTGRLGWRIPQANEKLNDFTAIIDALGTDAQNGTTGYSEGVASARPSAGTAGRIYRATDNGVVAFDDGTVWRPLGLWPIILTGSSGIANGQAAVVKGNTAAVTVTVPSPIAGGIVAIANLSSFPVTVAGLTASVPLNFPGAHLFLVSDGTEWVVLAGELDTGWLQLTAGTNMTTAPSGAIALQARQRGDGVAIRGVMETTAAFASGATATAASLPSGISNPSAAVEVSLQGSVGAGGLLLFPNANLNSAGNLVLGNALILTSGSSPGVPLGGTLASGLVIPVNFSY